MSEKKRFAEKIIEIDAPVEKVWKAITEADELTNWFPLDVKTYDNGRIKFLWGDNDFFNLQVVGFDLYKRIKLVELPPEEEVTDEILNKKVKEDLTAKKEVLAIEVTLESKKASTVLRLVHSGFGNEPHWDDIYEGVKRGWEFELRGLKHYIENHFTTKRYAVWIKKEHTLTLEETWKRLMNLFKNDVESLREHDPFTLEEKTGEVYKGITMLNEYPYTFVGTLTNFNNSILRFENYKTGDKIISYFFIAGYGIPQNRLDKLKAKWQKIYDTIFD